MSERQLKTSVPEDLGEWIDEQAKRARVDTATWLRRLLLREQTESQYHARATDIVDLIDLLVHEHVQQAGAPPGPLRMGAKGEPARRLNVLRGNLRAAILQAIRGHVTKSSR